MPRVQPETLAPSQIYGKQKVNNNLTMGERIRKRFKPTDTVKVHNITNTEIEWQWLEESDESYAIEDGSNVKIVERGDPQLWRLGAGEQDILMGSCAYLMIEALYKQMCAMKTGIVLHPLDEREIRNFAFDDPAHQEEVIDMIFQGKVTPQMMTEAAMQSLGGDFKPRILENLPALATEQDEFERRNAAELKKSERRIHTTAPVSDLAALQEEFVEEPKSAIPTPAADEGDDSENGGEEEAPNEVPEKSAVVKPLNRSKVVKEKQPVGV